MTKKEALERLNNDKKRGIRFNELLPLLGGMKAPQQFRYYNRSGYSEANLKSLEYDIKQSYGITSADLRKAAAEEKELENNDQDQDSDLGTKLDEPQADQTGNTLAGNDTKVSKIGTDIPKNDTKDTEGVTKETFFELAPDEVKKDIKLRERYPFLNEEETPEEFYTLVGINGRAYYQMIEARKELFKNLIPAEEGKPPVEEPMSNEAIFELAKKAVANFELNIEGEEELEYYKENKEVLGKHSIFEEYMLEKKVADYKEAYLATRRGLLKNYIGRDVPKLGTMEEDKKLDFIKKIMLWEQELVLLEDRLGIESDKRYESKLNESI